MLVTPAVFTIPPKGSQVVRVALRREADPRTELSYRLILTEVPQQAAPGFHRLEHGAADEPAGLRRRAGADRAASPVVGDTQRGRHGAVTALNAGSEHARVLDLMISPQPGDDRWLHQQGAYYVLPGQSRSWAHRHPDNRTTTAPNGASCA